MSSSISNNLSTSSVSNTHTAQLEDHEYIPLIEQIIELNQTLRNWNPLPRISPPLSEETKKRAIELIHPTDTCPIGLEPIEKKGICFPCGHVFEFSVITEYIDRTAPLCPLDRQRIRTVCPSNYEFLWEIVRCKNIPLLRSCFIPWGEPVNERLPHYPWTRAFQGIGKFLTNRDVGKYFVRSYPYYHKEPKFNDSRYEWTHIPKDTSKREIELASLKITLVFDFILGEAQYFDGNPQSCLDESWNDGNWLSVEAYTAYLEQHPDTSENFKQNDDY